MSRIRPWLAAAAAFVAMGTVFGVAYSFGAFFDAMSVEFAADASRTALVFSLTSATYFVLGVWTGRLGDRFGARPLMLVAALMLGGGLWATARATSLGLGYVTYGLGVGVAVAAAYVPSVAAVGRWFSPERRAAAMGLAISGIGVGTLLAAPVAALLIEAFGWRRAYEMMGVAGMALLVLAAAGIGAHSIDLADPPNPLPLAVFRDRGARSLYLGSLIPRSVCSCPSCSCPGTARGRGSDPWQPRCWPE